MDPVMLPQEIGSSGEVERCKLLLAVDYYDAGPLVDRDSSVRSRYHNQVSDGRGLALSFHAGEERAAVQSVLWDQREIEWYIDSSRNRCADRQAHRRQIHEELEILGGRQEQFEGAEIPRRHPSRFAPIDRLANRLQPHPIRATLDGRKRNAGGNRIGI